MTRPVEKNLSYEKKKTKRHHVTVPNGLMEW